MQNENIILVLTFIALAIAGLIYITPSIVAFRRNHPNRWIILVINMAFGGTVIGWGVALVWALRAVHKPGSTSSGGESGLNVFVNDVKKVQVVDPPAPSPVSAAQELERLHSLLTQGAISRAEFDELKAKLLQNPA